MICINDITIRYGKNIALSNVNCKFVQGEVTGLLGANGAGKTTLLRIVAGLIDNFDGNVNFSQSHCKIGYLPEQRGLFADQQVGEQLVFFAQLNGLKKKNAVENVVYWLDKLEASEWKNKKISQLSKGMAQKIQFIASVVHDPDLLLLDEPMSGLDPLHSMRIREIISSLSQQGKTIVLSTHNLDDAARLCNKYVILRQGKVTFEGGIMGITEQQILSML